MSAEPSTLHEGTVRLARWAEATDTITACTFAPGETDEGVTARITLVRAVRAPTRSQALRQSAASGSPARETRRPPPAVIDAQWQVALLSTDPLAAQAALTELLIREPPAGFTFADQPGSSGGTLELALAARVIAERPEVPVEPVRTRIVQVVPAPGDVTDSAGQATSNGESDR